MGLNLITAPAAEPVTLDEAKAHCRITTTAEDYLVNSWIIAARGHAETYTRRRFITQTWEWSMDEFPDYDSPIEVPNGPLQSVTSLKYIDTAGVEQTLDPTLYQVDLKSDPGRIAPAYAVRCWPYTRCDTLNAVTVRFVCGYGLAARVPKEIKQAMLLAIGDFNEHREASLDIEQYRNEAAESLLFPFRVVRF